LLSNWTLRLQNIHYQTQNISQNCTKQTAILYLCAIQNKQTMIFEFKNLGSIKEAQIEMGNLTVICGKNNTGKTYLTYAVWGLFKGSSSFMHGILFNFDKSNIIRSLKNDLSANIDLIQIEHYFKHYVISRLSNNIKNLQKIFDCDISFFEHTKIKVLDYNLDYSMKWEATSDDYTHTKSENSTMLQIKLSENYIEKEDTDYEHILDVIFRSVANRFIPYIQICTAQRDSIHLFKYAIGKRNSEIVKGINQSEQRSNYSMPLNDNINFSISFSSIENQKSFLHNTTILQEVEEMLGIKYIISNGNFSILNRNESQTPAFLASTSVRTLADLHFYLKHYAQKGDLLMIDEPELNLHPENQIKMARLFAKLVNVGIKVWITTHSDYIVKELNNLVMLGNVSDREEMLSRFKNDKGENEYSENDILKAEDLKAYIAYNLPDGSGATVRKIDVDKYGMVESTFDETIDKMNKISRTFAQHIAD
jgi:predicted ATPase